MGDHTTSLVNLIDHGWPITVDDARSAIAEIERLRADLARVTAENARLREAMPTAEDGARDAVFVASEIKRGTASPEDISRAADLLLRLAQVTSCLPSAEVRVAIRSLVHGTMERPNRVWPETENIVNEWLARLDAAKEVR